MTIEAKIKEADGCPQNSYGKSNPMPDGLLLHCS
jgi:hypothetical protein